MKKLEEMSIHEIIQEIDLYITYDQLKEVWKSDAVPKISILNPEGKSAIEQLKDDGFRSQIMDNPSKLNRFLYTHEDEIDKVRFVMTILRNYRKALEEGNYSPEERKKLNKFFTKTKQLLKGTNQTYAYYEKDTETHRIESVIFENTGDAAEGKRTLGKKENLERLKRLGDDFLDIIEPILLEDVEYMISYSNVIGKDLRFMIEYNSLLRCFNGDFEMFVVNISNFKFEDLIESLEHERFSEEKALVLGRNIEQVDFDKLLLMSAIRTFVALERGKSTQEQIGQAYKRLKVILEHIRPNAKITLDDSQKDDSTFRVRDMSVGMNRFILKEGEPTAYYTKKKCDKLRLALKVGVFLLNDATEEEAKAIDLTIEERDWILELFPENYIFYLRKNEIVHPVDRILENIINVGGCSKNLFQLICDKTDITIEQILQLFDSGLISVSDLKAIREEDLKKERNPRTIISDEVLFSKYQEYKALASNEEEKRKSARTQLEQYVLAYRNIELTGKTDEEKEDIGLNFIDEQFGDSIEDEDLISLYKFDIIPFEVAIGIGGPDIAKELLKNEGLKKQDILYLRGQGILTEEFIRNIFTNVCPTMSYSYQLLILYNAFDPNTQEGSLSIDRLQQFLHIESASLSTSKTAASTNRNKKQENEGTYQKPRIEMKGRDPGAKMNLLLAIDKDARVEEGIIDGHMIIHWPNVNDGVVMIEKLHDMKTDRKSRITIVTINNESATYTMSEQEFIGMRDQLVQCGKIDRTQLTRKWYDRTIPGNPDPNHWIPHVGAAGWELALLEQFEINENNPRYSKENIDEIESLMFASVDSKKQEYTSEHMEKIKRIISERLRTKEGEDR